MLDRRVKLLLTTVSLLAAAAPAALASGTTERVSVASSGAQGDRDSGDPWRSRPTAASSPSTRGQRPRPGRHQRQAGRLRPRPQAGHHRAGRARAGRRRRATTTAFDAGDLGERALRRLHLGRHQPRPGRHQRHATTSSCATEARHDRAGQRRAGRRPGRRHRRLRRRRSRPTGASSPSSPTPATSSRATPTSRRHLRPRPQDGHDRAGQRRAGRRAGQRRQRLRRRDLGGRALRRLRVGRHQPGAGRHQRRRRDVFVRDRKPGTTERVSVASARRPGATTAASSPSISADGRFVAFDSDATNLVPGDTNGVSRRLRPRPPGAARPSGSASASRGAQGDGGSFGPSISADGRFVAFSSDATDLVPGDTNGRSTCSSMPADPARLP